LLFEFDLPPLPRTAGDIALKMLDLAISTSGLDGI